MRGIVATAVLTLLTACAVPATLYPRGGGDVARGEISLGGSYPITVTLRGETYKGNATSGSSAGMVMLPGAKAPGLIAMDDGQFVAVLVSGTKTIRCQFNAAFMRGNGVCLDSTDRAYDLVIGS